MSKRRRETFEEAGRRIEGQILDAVTEYMQAVAVEVIAEVMDRRRRSDDLRGPPTWGPPGSILSAEPRPPRPDAAHPCTYLPSTESENPGQS